ncbi:MAG: winged helix-turn-helix domain-containing protein [Bacteroidales bacterium]|nr:winged helix-turn-helix domain-containing protein [Bacteroidales bacterium]
MNCDTIGANAGTVWTVLNDAEAMGTKQLKKAAKLKDKELFAAIGWLAREGKLMIDVDPEDPKELIITLERN